MHITVLPRTLQIPWDFDYTLCTTETYYNIVLLRAVYFAGGRFNWITRHKKKKKNPPETCNNACLCLHSSRLMFHLFFYLVVYPIYRAAGFRYINMAHNIFFLLRTLHGVVSHEAYINFAVSFACGKGEPGFLRFIPIRSSHLIVVKAK